MTSNDYRDSNAGNSSLLYAIPGSVDSGGFRGVSQVSRNPLSPDYIFKNSHIVNVCVYVV